MDENLEGQSGPKMNLHGGAEPEMDSDEGGVATSWAERKADIHHLCEDSSGAERAGGDAREGPIGNDERKEGGGQKQKRRQGRTQCRGLMHLEEMGPVAITSHLESLSAWLIHCLRKLRHPGTEAIPLIEIYGPTVLVERGAVVAFNVIDWKMDHVSPSLIKMMANRERIALSVGFLIKRKDNAAVQASGKLMQVKMLMSKSLADGGKAAAAAAAEKEVVSMIEVVYITLGLVSCFEDVFRLWEFIAQFLDPDFFYEEQRAHS
eukprot:TRINITY_DN847_c0_g3_i1.p1 TRINITY_DN847_c0_g3~~TRINITY_DN847_c0_g3_i1.p1  ORF type:complete len:306 (+),score=84.06 TRINITY_DN847_c0_g3_i1:131-919(+)